MSQYFFGTGSLYGRQTGVSNPTPIRFGAIQDVSVDFSFENKELYGQYQFALYVARGPAKIAGKAKFGQLFGAAFNNLFFNEASLGTTPVLTAIDEVQTVASCNATVTNSANYVQDLGVLNPTLGTIMSRVAAAPSGTGNYSVNETTGVYTFNTAMNGLQVQITYDYNGAAGAGTLITGANQLMGASPQFMMVLAGSLGGKAMRIKLNACMSTKLTLATKLTDFTLPELDFMGFVDTSGNWGSMSFAE